MAVGDVMRVLHLVSALVAPAVLFACSVSAAATFDRAEHEGRVLELVEMDGACAVTVDGSAPLAVDLPAPCAFLRRPSTKLPIVHVYDGVGAVALATGGLAAGRPPKGCGDTVRAIILDGEGVRLGGSDRGEKAFCVDVGFDEKLYYGLSHPPE